MKKLFLFTCLSVLSLTTFTACSDDDSSSAGGNNGGTLTMTFDGVVKTYNTVTVTEFPETEDYTPYYWVTASQDGGADETVSFRIDGDYTGTDAMWDLQVVAGGESYYIYDANTNVTVNNGSKLKGSFSGEVTEWDSNAQQEVTLHTISGGSFDINY